MKYRGIIVEESLVDNRILNNMDILKVKITSAENKDDRWHLFEVDMEENKMENLSKQIIEGWYAHFWHGMGMNFETVDIIIVFTNKIFKFNYMDKKTWEEVIEYGKKLNISSEELDFHIFGI